MTSTSTPQPPRKLDALAALLSFLVPGMGQIYQGRVGKGILFLLSLYTLFFYGMWMGQWSNVYLPDSSVANNYVFRFKPLGDVENRVQFAGQFWIGIAAWPAVIQYAASDPNQPNKELPILKSYQKAPSETRLNELQRNGDKRWDLGWVYTVIAGVLNILVIYDALAGPVHRDVPGKSDEKKEAVAS